jgi:hypothetical protein
LKPNIKSNYSPCLHPTFRTSPWLNFQPCEVYLLETKALIEAGVASDYLDQANQLLEASYKDAAAVIVGAVLEKHLRFMCDARGISTLKANGKPMAMNELNNELAMSNTYNLLKKKQITTWAEIRNKAAHGHFESYTAEDVSSMLRDIYAFCADNA